MPRMPLDDECRRSLLRRLPVHPRLATVRDVVRSYGYLDRSRARYRSRNISRVDRSLSPCIRAVDSTLVTRWIRREAASWASRDEGYSLTPRRAPRRGVRPRVHQPGSGIRALVRAGGRLEVAAAPARAEVTSALGRYRPSILDGGELVDYEPAEAAMALIWTAGEFLARF